MTWGVLLKHQAPIVPEAFFGWLQCGDTQMVREMLEHKADVHQYLWR